MPFTMLGVKAFQFHIKIVLLSQKLDFILQQNTWFISLIKLKKSKKHYILLLLHGYSMFGLHGEKNIRKNLVD